MSAAFTKICRENPDVFKVVQKFQALCIKIQVLFVVATDFHEI
jgi:hypothetical protein